MPLTNKQQVFVNEYLRTFNATAAAKAAGYSPKTATAIGAENLTKPYIAEAIRAGIAERAMGADEVLQRLAEHARGDIGDFLDISSMGFVLDLSKAERRGLTHLIKKVKLRTTTTLSKDGVETETHDAEIELYDAQAALEKLGRYHKLFTDRTEVTGLNGTPLLKGYVGVSPDDWDEPA